MNSQLPYHPCTSILIQGLIDLKAYRILYEWDQARAIVDEQLLKRINKETDNEIDPCPSCTKGSVCRTPACGRLKLGTNHPFRTRITPKKEANQ